MKTKMSPPEARFTKFIHEVLSDGFDKFVTLYIYNPEPTVSIAQAWADFRNEKKQAAKRKRFNEGRTALDNWIKEMGKENPGLRYVLMIERPAKRWEFSFHVLLGGCDWAKHDTDGWWDARWSEMTNGRLFERELDERVAGLLRYFVFKADCNMEVHSWHGSGFYWAHDFEDSGGWKPY